MTDVDIKDLLLLGGKDRPSSTTIDSEEPSVKVERVEALSGHRPSKVAKRDVYSEDDTTTTTTRQRRRAKARQQQMQPSSERRHPSPKDGVEDHLRKSLAAQSEIILEQRELIQQLREHIYHYEDTNVFLVLDTESFTFHVMGHDVLLPLQIAWSIFQWDSERGVLEDKHHCTIYISELMCVSEYREAVRRMSHRCFERHEEKMSSTNFPLMTANQALTVLLDDLTSFHVNTIVGYNLSWDFQSIRNLRNLFIEMDTSPVFTELSCTADNPFSPLGLNYLDLMHQTVKSYGEELVLQGIKDGTVHRSATSDRVMLKKNQRYGKSVYSAEYVLQHFFGVFQNHLADDDVRYEALLLEKCLVDFGLRGLEFNILYPQQSCYQRMIQMAHGLLDAIDMDEDSFVVPDGEGEDVEVHSSDDEEVAELLRSLSATLVMPPTEEECLFESTDDGDDVPPPDSSNDALELLATFAAASLEQIVQLSSDEALEPASINDR